DYKNSHDRAYSFTAAGFESGKEEQLRKELLVARAQGKKFPDYKDLSSFPMTLLNRSRQSALDAVVDFGDGETTWRKIIDADRLLPGSGPILPRFFVKDLFQYEE